MTAAQGQAPSGADLDWAIRFISDVIRLHGPAYTPLLARALAEKEKADQRDALVAKALSISRGGEIGGLDGPG